MTLVMRLPLSTSLMGGLGFHFSVIFPNAFTSNLKLDVGIDITAFGSAKTKMIYRSRQNEIPRRRVNIKKKP